MVNIQKWDWNTKEKMVADTTGWPNQFEDVQEPYVSPDGEKIASIVKQGEGEYSVCVNGETWEEPFEKLWSCKFTPDGRVSVLSSRDMEWTMTVDGEPWETAYEYIWDPKFSADGKLIVATVK
ncbi:MAG: WD40 repeat domain-containing protein, partial [Desulfobacterales bacterium]|nr:WD40 repeat domain-containing protein [Desulfobacterales bacterium]